MTDWTDEKVEILKQLYIAGIPIYKIAKQLNCTRNAVIGKVVRLELNKNYRQKPSI